MSASVDNLVQKLGVIVLGRPADAALLQWASNLSGEGWAPLVAQVNAHLGARAAAIGAGALVAQLAYNAFGIRLTPDEAATLAAPIAAGTATWADLLAWALLNTPAPLADTLAQRAEAAAAFTQALHGEGKESLYTGAYLQGAASALLQSITSDAGDVAQGIETLLAWVTGLSDSGAAGTASSGRVSAGDVFVDANGNGAADPGELRATTAADGTFLIPTGADAGSLIVSGGTDILTQAALTVMLKAPEGATVVNGLTTLAQFLLAEDATGSTLDAAQAATHALGLPPTFNALVEDPIAVLADAGSSSQALASALAAQKAITQLVNLVSHMVAALDAATPLSGSDANALAWSAVARVAAQGPLQLQDIDALMAIMTHAVQDYLMGAVPASLVPAIALLAGVTAEVNQATAQTDTTLELAKAATVGQGLVVAAIGSLLPTGDLAELGADFTGASLAQAIDEADHGTLLPNVAPQGTDRIVTLDRGEVHTFDAADFGFADANVMDYLAAVRIDTLPARGTLLLAGQPIAAGATIDVDLIPSLVYMPDTQLPVASEAGFLFSVRDSQGEFDAQANILSLHVGGESAAAFDIAATAGPIAYIEQGEPLAIDPGLVITDGDDSPILRATVRIAQGRQDGDSLHFTDTAAIKGSYDAASGALTLTGEASAADYEAALRSVRFQSARDDPAASKSIEFVLYEAGLATASANRDIAVTGINDAPVATAGGTLHYAENAAAQAIAPAAMVSDPDSVDFQGGSLTVAITANRSGADRLGILDEGTGPGQIGVTGNTVSYSGVPIGSYSGGSAGTDLVIGFTSTAAAPQAVQALMRAINFANASDDPSTLTRSVRFTVTDGDGGSATATSSVTVSAANDAPVLSLASADATYVEGTAAIAVDANVGLADADDALLDGATVSLTGGFLPSDALTFTNTTGITGTYDDSTGVLTLTGSDTPANYEAALRSVTFSSSSEDPGAARIVTVTVSDGDSSASATRSIALTPVNDAPVVTLAGMLDYTENDAAALLAPSATLTDADSADFGGGSLTVAFTANGAGDDQLAIRHEGTAAEQIGVAGNTVTYGGTDIGTFAIGEELVVSFNTAATPAAVQALMRAVTYVNTSDAPSTLERTVNFTVVDGDGTAHGGDTEGSDTVTIAVTAVNDRPEVTTSSGTAAFTEGGAAVAVDAAIAVADTDSDTLASATVRIASGYLDGEDALAFTASSSTGNIAASTFDAATGTLTLVSSGATATPAQWQAALASITFDTTSVTPGTSRTIGFQLDDGSAANNLSLGATRDIAITEVNSAPILAGAGGTTAYVEDAGAVTVATGFAVTDDDGAMLEGATVSIASGFVASEDLLMFTPVAGITTTGYDASTGKIVFTGAASHADYVALLASVQYANLSDAPDTAARTIAYTVDDGQSVSYASNTVTQTVTVTAANDAPTVTGPGSLAFTEGQAASVIAAMGEVADPDSADLDGGSLKVHFEAGGSADDQLAIRHQGTGPEEIGVDGADVTYGGTLIGTWSGGTNGTALVVNFTGTAATAAAAEALVRNITFANASEAPTPDARTVRYTLADGDGGSSHGDVTVNVAAVNDAPSVAIADEGLATDEDTAIVFSSGSGNLIAVADADAAATGVQVALTAAEGLLTLSGTTGLSFTAGDGSGDARMTFTGTIADVNTALAGMSFMPVPNYHGSGASVSIDVDDQGNTGGGALTDSGQVLITVASVNDAPVIADAAGTLAYTENDALTVIDASLTLSDADRGETITGATVTISGGYAAGQDVLGFTPSDGITGVYADGVLTLGGTASPAAYEAVLESVTYRNTSDSPTDGERTITWSVTDGNVSAGANGALTASATSTVTVAVVNDAPIMVVPATTGLGTAMSNVGFAVAGISVSDVDAGTADLQTTVTVTQGTVSFSLAGGATVSAGANGSSTVTLEGSLDELNDALATFTFTGTDGLTAPVTAEVSVITTDLGNTGTGGALQSNAGVADTFQIGVIPQVFVVDKAAGASTPAGTLSGSIAAFKAGTADGSGDFIFLRSGTYTETDGFDLADGQFLIGQGEGLSFTNPVTGEVIDFGAAGAAPTIAVTGSGNQAIALAEGNTVRSLDVATSVGTTGIADSGGTVGSLTVGSVNVTGAGTAVDIDAGGTLDVAFGMLSSSGGAYGVNLGGTLAGTFTATGGTLAGHTSAEFRLDGGTGTVSYAGTIGDGTGASVVIADRTGTSEVTFSGTITDSSDAGGGISVSASAGAVTFSGTAKTLITGATGGVTLTGNSGTVSFTNGGLAIASAGATGFLSSGGGTVSVAGAGNSIVTTGAAGLSVSGTAIGAADLTFQSVSASGGTNGILLNSTGASGSLVITGTGSAGSGGTIQDITGDGNDATTAGDGISVTSGRIVLRNIVVQDTEGHGIGAYDLLGDNYLADSAISGFDTGGGHTENGLKIANAGTNTLGSMTVTGTSFSGGADGNAGIFMEARGSGDMTLVVTDSEFSQMFGDGVLVNGTSSATGTVELIVSGSSFHDAQAGVGNGGISMNPFGDVDFIVDIEGNTFTRILDQVVTLGAISMTNGGTADADVTIRGNTIDGNLGGYGIAVTATGGTTDLLIEDNTIDDLGTSSGYAMFINFTSSVSAGTTATGNVTLANNEIGQHGAAAGKLWPTDGIGGAIWLNAQAGSTMTAALTGNLVDVNTTSSIEAVWLRAIGGSTLNVTATGNDIDDTAGTSVEMNVQAGLSSTEAGTVNLGMSGNDLHAGELRLTERTLGTIAIAQASAALLSSLNGDPTVIANAGSASYGAVAPPYPTTPELPAWLAGVGYTPPWDGGT